MPPRKKGILRSDEQRRNGCMRFTTFPVVQPINQKNYYTEYLKREDQLLLCRIADKTWPEEEGKTTDPRRSDEEGSEEEEKQENDAKVLVIHPGSLNLRIGLASDAFPQVIPNVIAHRCTTWVTAETSRKKKDASRDTTTRTTQFEHAVQEIDAVLKARLRLSKRRAQTNAYDLVIAYNQAALPEAALDPTDSVEWTDVSTQPAYLVGQDVLQLPLNALNDYVLYWPLRHRVFNAQDYASSHQCIDDVAAILVAALDALGIRHGEWKPLAVVLVIPDIYDKLYVEGMLDMLIRELQFSKVCVLQESVCTAFGAGLSAACVVDVGAQTTSIACVEEGICLPESRIQLPYGGDDVTRFFIRLLQRGHFPYKEIDLSRIHDWQLADTLKIQHCTANESAATVQLLHFFRNTLDGVLRYSFKVYDEPILAAMSYLFPTAFQDNDTVATWETEDKSAYTAHTSRCESRYDGAEMGMQCMPLDDAIIHSINRVCEHAPSDERSKTMYASILLVGGGHAFPGFVHLLEDRLRTKQSTMATIRLLSPPREMDPQMLAWKGASVFSQLKISRDFWIKQKEWDLLGLRCLQHRSLGYFWNG